MFDRFTPRNRDILEVLKDVAKQVERTPAQVALNRAATRPGVFFGDEMQPAVRGGATILAEPRNFCGR